MDGGVPTISNTVPLAINSGSAIKPVRYVIRNAATGWTAVYLSQEVLAVKAATAGTTTIAPTTPTFTLVQLGSAPGNFALNITADTTNGRVGFFALTDAAATLTVTAEIKTVETP